MSLDIDQIALHQLVKRDEQTLDVVLRDSLLPANAAVEEMMAELHRVYSAKSKAYGLFSEDSELATALRGCRKGDEDFHMIHTYIKICSIAHKVPGINSYWYVNQLTKLPLISHLLSCLSERSFRDLLSEATSGLICCF